jgi:hypothetical protein
MKIGPFDWETGDVRDQSQPPIVFGFSALNPCDRCLSQGRPENVDTCWMSVDDPSHPGTADILTLHLCRDCLFEALLHTYEGGELRPADWTDLQVRYQRIHDQPD